MDIEIKPMIPQQTTTKGKNGYSSMSFFVTLIPAAYTNPKPSAPIRNVAPTKKLSMLMFKFLSIG